MLPEIGQDTITTEDVKFRAYLEEKGWDTRQMGSSEYQANARSEGSVVDGLGGEKAVEATEKV